MNFSDEKVFLDFSSLENLLRNCNKIDLINADAGKIPTVSVMVKQVQLNDAKLAKSSREEIECLQEFVDGNQESGAYKEILRQKKQLILYDKLAQSDQYVFRFLQSIGVQQVNLLHDKLTVVDGITLSGGDLRRLVGSDVLALRIALQEGLLELVKILSSSPVNSSDIRTSLDLARERLGLVAQMNFVDFVEFSSKHFEQLLALLELPYFKK